MNIFRNLITHPLTRGLAMDDPRTTSLRSKIIQENRFLRHLYVEWYQNLKERAPAQGQILELGSGAGFLGDFLPGIITSEMFSLPGIRMVADGCQLPIADHALAAIILIDVFHHLQDVKKFLSEATRCVHPGGKILMIEPWVSPWSKWVYTHLHYEPFSLTEGWEVSPAYGPLSSANNALPWIVFERDRQLFSELFPSWQIVSITPFMPFSYLLSGGVTARFGAPGWIYQGIRNMEQRLDQKHWAMFAQIELEAQFDT
ncbi:MAG: class I SAM-dependent methyltransferase [Magnetococcus sp. DMHC-1]